jgi:hypothetical protein
VASPLSSQGNTLTDRNINTESQDVSSKPGAVQPRPGTALAELSPLLVVCICTGGSLSLLARALQPATRVSDRAGTSTSAFRVLGAVVAQRAIGVRGPIRESYLVGALDTSDETKHRTEICWPVFQAAPAD